MQEQSQEPRRQKAGSSEFVDALKKGALIGVALLAIIIPVMRMGQKPQAPQPPPVAVAPQAPGAAIPQAPAAPQAPTAPQAPAAQAPAVPSAPSQPGLRLADFRGEDPTPEARLVANWAVHTRNHKQHAIVVIDKKDARVYVFTPTGQLVDSAPALLGSARGDNSFPGIGDKPLSAIHPYEKTTPAGRFVAEPGLNANHEDVVWVDYDAAVSMHRIRPTNPKERRLERLASLTTDDNRISFGCVNLPVTFYENVLSPAVKRHGAVIYVLPEVKTPQQVFGAYDVLAPRNQAKRDAMQRVALHVR